MSATNDQNRVRIYSIPRNFLLDLLNGYREGMLVRLVESTGLPQDAEIVEVSHDIETRGIKILVRSDEFDPVPAFERIPFERIIPVNAKVAVWKNIKESHELVA